MNAPRCAIYCRVSTTKQEDEGTSLTTQLDSCRAYAASKGYTVVAEYQETFTGTALYERPKLSALRESVRGKVVDVVVCHAIDRLSRDAVHLGVLLSEADHKGVSVAFVSEPLDDSPEGQLIRFIRGYAGKIEHAKIKERSKRGREQRAQSGKPIPGGSPPLGYTWRWGLSRTSGNNISKKTVIGWDIDPETAPLIRRMFRFVAEGGSVTALAKVLNAEGVPTSKGGQYWYHTTLRWMIKHPLYKGQPEALRGQYEMVSGGRTHTRPRPVEERIQLPAETAPALVTPEEWQAANDQLARNRTEAKRNNPHPEAFLLRSGFAFCGYCGGPLIARNHEGQPKYSCSSQNRTNSRQCPGGGTMAAPELDAAVWERVYPILMNPEELLEEIEQDLAGEDTTGADLESINREIDRITRQQTMIANGIAKLDDVDAAEPLLAKLEFLSKQKIQLTGERGIIESRRADLISGQKLLDLMSRELHSRIAGVNAMTYQEKRQALRRLGVSVKLWKVKHEPRYQIDMAVSPAIWMFEPDDLGDVSVITAKSGWSDSLIGNPDNGIFDSGAIMDTTSPRTGHATRPRRRRADRADRRGRLPATPISPPARR